MYILPVGYEQNNIFLTDWNEEDFGDLDFYDIFDAFYPILYQQSVPYATDENLGVGAVYQIPEVVSYTENQDGTITLIINAVYPNSNTSMAYSHRTVIRPLSEESFQYVSNQMISMEDDHDIWWHSNRLSKEEWLEIYE